MSPPATSAQPPPPPSPSADDYRLLVESVVDYAIFMLDPGGHVATWNRGAEALKGYRADEIVGGHFSAFYPPEDVEAGKPAHLLAQAAALGRVEDEGWRVRKDGTRFWADVVITALRDEAGALRGFGKVTRDLTARRATEERLRAAEERFHLLVDAVTDYAIFMLDLDGRVATWNPGAERAKGYRAEEVIGQHFSIFYPPEGRAAGRPGRMLDAVRAEGRVEDEGWRVRKDGTRFWASVVVTALHDGHGRLLGFAKVTRDLTARRQAEEAERRLLQERAARAAAEEASRIKDDFLAIVSHELRTPLNAVLGWTRLLRAGALDAARTAQALEVVERNAGAQAQLIEDLLDVSRITAGKVRLQLRPVDLTEVVNAALDAVRPAADAKGIRLQATLDASIRPLVGDPDRLQQVVWNFLTNAVKFTPKGGRAWVRVRPVDSSIEIEVGDTGRGIAPEFLPHVFERFRQAEGGSARAHGGLGLGLAIAKSLVELHGGTVEAKSEGEGRGATFVARLPVAPLRVEDAGRPSAHPRAGSPSPAFARPPQLGGTRVLVVDDDADGRGLVVAALAQCGVEVAAVASAAEAIERLATAGFDAIVSDIGMPAEDGYALIGRIRALPPDAGGRLPAVALTAFARGEDRTRALAAGFDVHIAKPVDPAELVLVLARLVERGRVSP